MRQSSEFIFGVGDGHLSQKVAKIAKKHGAALVNHCDPGCKCGYGCAYNCPATRRHWFAGPNRGEPFNGRLSDNVLAEVAKGGAK